MPEDGLLEVGRVVKPHGLTGEVVVDLWSEPDVRLAPGTSLLTDDGPLEVVAARPHQGRYLVRFAGVEDRAGAEALRGRTLLAEPLETPGVMWVHQLIGAQAVQPDGRVLGTVVAVEPNPASDLLVLDGGGLVPLRFVTEVDPGARVVVDAPEGLVD